LFIYNLGTSLENLVITAFFFAFSTGFDYFLLFCVTEALFTELIYFVFFIAYF